MYSARAGKLMNALNAVLEPMLMSESKQRQIATRQSALTGIFNVGCTLANTLGKWQPFISGKCPHKSRHGSEDVEERHKDNEYEHKDEEVGGSARACGLVVHLDDW